MKHLRSFGLVAVVIALLAVVLVPAPAQAGVGKALSVVADQVLETTFVAGVTHQGPGFAFTSPVALEFGATRDVYHLTDKLSVTIGADMRAAFAFASDFNNLGLGAGLKYNVAGPFSIHASYTRDVIGASAAHAAGDSPSRVFVAIGFTPKTK